MNIKRLIVLAVILCFIAVMSVFSPGQNQVSARFHTEEELRAFNDHSRAPIGEGQYFLNSFRCSGCHGRDSTGNANVNEAGDDVNLYDHWQPTMMANSARDPLWRAKVSQEITTNPAHSSELQDKCTSCHAPMGRYTKFYHEEGHYTMDEIDGDSLAYDGVSCAGCHTIGPNGLGSMFSGSIPYDTTRKAYGPFPNPETGPMLLYEGYTPTFSLHMDEARVCSPCHTLYTNTADLDGNLTGTTFPEQVTYHEYLNSSFPANDITCQKCHMPRIEDPIIIANGLSGLTPRTPFNQHTFQGANYFMLNLMKENKEALGITVDDWKYDTTLAATSRSLKQQSIDLELTLDNLTADTAFFTVKLRNKAGHKFPSGYPSRRAVVQLVVLNANNDTVFKSGIFGSDGRVNNETPAYEPHHNVIKQSGKSQIYEMVMGDVNSNYTSTLERAAVMLKDNRIPPDGFTASSSVYDTVAIVGVGGDTDFNFENSTEGSGTDAVHYHVPVAAFSGNISVYARMYYQTVPPKFLDEMFALSTAPINTFRDMYNNADKQPFLMQHDSLLNVQLITGIAEQQAELMVYPSLTFDGRVSIISPTEIKTITVYNAEGKIVLCSPSFLQGGGQGVVNLPATSGIYFIVVQTANKTFHRKVLRQ
jgi:hypothetical protein